MAKFLLHCLLSIFQITLMLINCLGQTGIIRGVVKERESVLPWATVTLGNKTELTDKKGEFRFSVRPGIYTLTVTHAGYKKIEQEIKVDGANTQTFEFTLTPEELMDEVVVRLGSRSPIHRSSLNSAVPVKVFSSALLRQTGQAGLSQMLNFSAPSVNSSRQLLYESITMRGLDPDHVLILLNSTRYHNMAFTNADGIRGHLGKGAIANDVNSIPFSAIENIEIMSDGATAQYGSDAIAGVMDIQLKESTGKTSIQLYTGQTYDGDGEQINLGVNRGVTIGKNGFLNFSLDVRGRNHTHRGGEYEGLVYPGNDTAIDNAMILTRNFNRNIVSNAGDAKFRGLGILINGGYHIGDKTKLFWTVAGNTRKNHYIATYILPRNERQLNHAIFPDGFRPQPVANSKDLSGIAGIKGETQKRWRWGFSSAYGSNTGVYQNTKTNNSSQYYTYGKNAQIKFYTGTHVYRQLTNSINFSKEFSFKKRLIQTYNVHYGFEWRVENYTIKPGEEAAWQNYDSLGRKQGGAQVSLVFHPENVVNKTRNVIGTFIDFETEFNSRLFIDLAGRYEYYNDFGGNVSGKIAIRYKITGRFSLRGSIGNGFRAPALQQRYYSTTTSGVTNIGGVSTAVTNGIYRNDSEVAKAFGVPALQPEKSQNISAGLTSQLMNRLSMTIDAYYIQIKNRVIQSGIFDRNVNPQVDSLLRVHNLTVDRVQFFANAINTRTSGIDVVLNSNWTIKKGSLVIMLGANFTKTRLFGDIKVAENLTPDSLNTNTLFGRLERTRVERGQPNHKIILLTEYRAGRFGFLLRNTLFGETAVASIPFPNVITLDENFTSKILTDVSISYSPKTWITITAGVNNIFDVYPDRLKNYSNTGQGQYIYAMEASPFGFNGGYYYVNMSFNF